MRMFEYSQQCESRYASRGNVPVMTCNRLVGWQEERRAFRLHVHNCLSAIAVLAANELVLSEAGGQGRERHDVWDITISKEELWRRVPHSRSTTPRSMYSPLQKVSPIPDSLKIAGDLTKTL